MGSQGTAAARNTLKYIFPGQLEHNTPLILLGVSGPGLRGKAAMSPPFQSIGAPSLATLAHKTPSARYPWPPAAISSDGLASSPPAGLARVRRASSHSSSVLGNALVPGHRLTSSTVAASLSAHTLARCSASLNSTPVLLEFLHELALVLIGLGRERPAAFA